MILSNRSNGPRYSTDLVANSVSRFVSERQSIASAPQRPAAIDAPGTLEEFYPSLFATMQPGAYAIALRALRSAFAKVVTSLAHRRVSRNASRY